MEPMDPLVERIIREALGNNSNNQTFTLQTPETSRWSLLALVVAGLVSGFSLYIAADAKNQARSDRQELLDEIRALKDTDNAIRAYINTGILKPKPPEKSRAN